MIRYHSKTLGPVITKTLLAIEDELALLEKSVSVSKSGVEIEISRKKAIALIKVAQNLGVILEGCPTR